jgi:serine/threonine protein kinase/predicted esterase
MPTDHWHRVEHLFMEAIEQPLSMRAAFLAGSCGPDADLRHEIETLLAAAEQSGDFLTTPALDVFARQISREGWSIQPGDRIASYTVERRLGTGGMGEVWRARDERLGRDVAIKFLLPHPSNADQRVRAFRREANAAGTLNHPNVLTVYDVGDHGDAPYLVTECLEGEPLRARLAAGRLSVDTALDIAVQVARGLGAAHRRGIVHRDLKPENIFLVLDGRVKILDFGLATLHDSTSPQASPMQEAAPETMRSLIAGTAGYMAPEQICGEIVDQRADIFALGAVLYETLAGCQAFKGESTLMILDAALTVQPPDVSKMNSEVSPALSHIVRRCLAKSPDDRFATIAEVESALDSVIRARGLPPPPGLFALFRRPVVMVSGLLVILAVSAGAWRWSVVASRVRWAQTIARPEVELLMKRGDYAEAFLLVRQALDLLPDDPQLKKLWLDVSTPEDMTTDPAGADIAIAPYRNPTKSWFPLGQTPLKDVRIPRGHFRVRVSKTGFASIEGSGAKGILQRYRLDSVDAVPPGMVRVVSGRDAVRFGLVGDLDDYWIDRFEVTNRQFKEFVDRGGYRQRNYWREPFVEQGRIVPWEEAVERFRDATGRQGPATWNTGTYPDGQADFPVGGVSWYEAAAYAAFAGKSLPTIYHWYRAAALGRFADILPVSNFNGSGPAPVGSYNGLGPFGTYDMAGNVKEWCWTEANHRRTLLGGAWKEPRYMFADYDARDPFERAPCYGFRLVKYIQPLPPDVAAPVKAEGQSRDARKEKPVGDDIFAVYRRLYAYDRTPLNAVIEATEETETYRKHTIELDAAYGPERTRVLLFLPKTGTPPYQTVLFFPAGDAFRLRSSRDMSFLWGDSIIRSGRAFVHPVYEGTFERVTPPGRKGANAEREIQISWSRDLGRAIDYLETRSDIDQARLAFYGVSAGAEAGVSMVALEPRLKTSVFQGGGLAEVLAPEIDPLNFASRVRIPTLMLNGRYDFELPFETAIRPLFALLAAPAEHKKHAVFETGHALPFADVAREMLPWFDRYLGPVIPSQPASARSPTATSGR